MSRERARSASKTSILRSITTPVFNERGVGLTLAHLAFSSFVNTVLMTSPTKTPMSIAAARRAAAMSNPRTAPV